MTRISVGLHFGCLPLVRGFNPESERGDRVPEIEKVATEPDLPTAFQPNLMLEPIPGVMI
jgi:hypothetical protein